jgi:preprotein translocase subunit SecE
VDIVKLLASLGILVAAIAGFYIFEDQAVWIRLLGMLALIGLAVFIAVQTEKGRNLWRFANQAQIEVQKVVWPTRQETLQTLLIIAVAVLLTSLFLWGIDSLLSMIVLYATGQG